MLNRGKPVIGLIAVLWAVELINLLLGHRLNGLGILPRTSSGLPGIILSPFLHHGILHLLSNTLPLLILGWFVTLGGNPDVFDPLRSSHVVRRGGCLVSGQEWVPTSDRAASFSGISDFWSLRGGTEKRRFPSCWLV